MLSYEAWLISTTAQCCLDPQEQAGSHLAGQGIEKLIPGIPRAVDREAGKSLNNNFLFNRGGS